MRVGLLGRKVGMTQIYQEDGTAVPVTVLECGPCTVLQVRTEERDGYAAVQLGFADKKRKNATQAERGHAKKVNAEPKRYVREIRQENPADVAGVNEGQTLTVEVFNEIGRVDVIGHEQGTRLYGRHQAARVQGLAGHARREAHAPPSRLLRAPAPIRPDTRKGIRKPGHYGHARVTVRNLEVVRVDPTNNLLLIRAPCPGPTAAT